MIMAVTTWWREKGDRRRECSLASSYSMLSKPPHALGRMINKTSGWVMREGNKGVGKNVNHTESGCASHAVSPTTTPLPSKEGFYVSILLQALG